MAESCGCARPRPLRPRPRVHARAALRDPPLRLAEFQRRRLSGRFPCAKFASMVLSLALGAALGLSLALIAFAITRVRRCEDLAQSSSKIDVTPSCGQAWPRRSASGSGSLSRGAFHRAWKLAVKSPRKRLIQSVLDRREAEDGEPKRVDVSGDRRVGRGGDKPRVVTARVLSRGPTRRRGARRGFRRDAAPS